MKIFAPCNIALLRWTLIALGLACAWVVHRSALRILDGDYLAGSLGVAFWTFLAAGLWFRLAVARWVALAILWVIVVIILLGTINPFAAMDELGPYPPSIWNVLFFHVAPWVIPSLLAIHVLGKFKSAFRWRLRAAA